MSKALVIKNVDFSTNKLDTVTLIDPIPCTAISLNKSTATMDEMLSTEALVATVTPANTTDIIMWSSSNENIATVSENGVVTQIGVGTVTITATCGNQSATCVITASVVYHLDTDCTVIHGEGIQVSDGEGKDFLVPVDSTRQRSYVAIGNPLNGYKAVSQMTGYEDYFPIPLPKNAQSLTITVSGESQVYTSGFCNFVDANHQTEWPTLAPSQRGCKYYSAGGGVFSGAMAKTVDLTSLDSNVNAFTVRMTALSGTDESMLENEITITFE